MVCVTQMCFGNYHITFLEKFCFYTVPTELNGAILAVCTFVRTSVCPYVGMCVTKCSIIY